MLGFTGRLEKRPIHLGISCAFEGRRKPVDQEKVDAT